MSQSQFSAQAKPTEFLGLCQAINPSQYLTLADTETYRITKIEKSPLGSSSPTIPQTAEVTTDPCPQVPHAHSFKSPQGWGRRHRPGQLCQWNINSWESIRQEQAHPSLSPWEWGCYLPVSSKNTSVCPSVWPYRIGFCVDGIFAPTCLLMEREKEEK